METRAFNSIFLDKYNGFITKTSKNIIKLKDEINYYLSIPNSIINLFPKLINYSGDYSSYTIEYIPYKSLSQLIISNQISFEEGKNILNKLFDILEEIHSIRQANLSSINVDKRFLIQKTIDRIDLLKNEKSFSELIVNNTITINGKFYKTFEYYQEQFTKIMNNFLNQNSISTIIHGDFSFSNILYCPITKNIKLIDPRGSFGYKGIYGHSYYDYAKLMHCIDGRYDYIVSGKFELIEQSSRNFSFYIYNSSLLSKLYSYFQKLLLKHNFNIEIILLIESSLFLSMSALHYEDLKRQKALFLNGLIIINNFFKRNHENMY